MATSGTPNEGRDQIIKPRVYISGMKLLLYTNAANSLDQDTVLVDLVEPTGTGTAQKTLNGVYSVTDGIVTYDDGTPDDPLWENTGGGNWSLPVTGSAITDGTYILHFKDFTSPVTFTPGKKVEIDISTFVSI